MREEPGRGTVDTILAVEASTWRTISNRCATVGHTAGGPRGSSMRLRDRECRKPEGMIGGRAPGPWLDESPLLVRFCLGWRSWGLEGGVPRVRSFRGTPLGSLVDSDHHGQVGLEAAELVGAQVRRGARGPRLAVDIGGDD